MKHEVTVRRGVQPYTTRFNVTESMSRPSIQCIELMLYDVPGELLEAIRTHDVKVTLEVVQTREERLREARLRAVHDACHLIDQAALAIVGAIERVDAEFTKGEK